ncbi:MAG: hypothetical protein ACOY45_00605 [Pseudomonadota bacterium]
MRKFLKWAAGGIIGAAAMVAANGAQAQAFDPRPALGSLINAFQACTPSPAYQMMAPALFQTVAQQTNGSGCYPAIRAAGPIQGMQVIDYREFPIGPMYVVRVFHMGGPVDWFIGFNRVTAQVEYLNFQGVQGPSAPQPTINTGPTGGTINPVPAPSPTPGAGSGGSGGSGEGCDLYPAMCQ